MVNLQLFSHAVKVLSMTVLIRMLTTNDKDMENKTTFLDNFPKQVQVLLRIDTSGLPPY